MIQHAIILSLQILAIHLAFSDGNIFSPVRGMGGNLLDKVFGKITSITIQKPLWDCYVCMASVWTITLSRSFDIFLILLVCGINYIIYKTFFDEEAAGS